MQTRGLTDKLSVSSQLTLTDLTVAADQGFRSIINNRPDGEAPDQPTSAEIEAAAAALGLGYRHIPVVPGQIRDEDVASFDTALAELEAPILAFCGTGIRSTTLWSISTATKVSSPDLLSTARAAGHDVNVSKPRSDARSEAATGGGISSLSGRARPDGRVP